MPTVKRRFGACPGVSNRASSSNTALTWAGRNSFDDRPYRPPITCGDCSNGAASVSIASWRVAITSSSSGSPVAPGSLVRSSTAIDRTVGGNARTKCSAGNGRYRRTFNSPTRSPAAVSASTVSSAVPDPEPISTTTRSASGVADIVDQAVLAPAAGGKLSEHFLDDAGHRVVERVGRLARLEEHVGVLRRAAQLRRVGCEPRRRWATTASSSTNARRSASSSTAILSTSCDVRKPSKKCMNGTRARSVAA